MKFDKDMRAGIAANEMYIPRKYIYLAREYPEVAWEQANIIWKNSVENVKAIYKAKYLIDIPFGQGYVEAFAEFKRMLEKANHQAEIEKNFRTVMNEMGL